jgi:hypothetical protein
MIRGVRELRFDCIYIVHSITHRKLASADARHRTTSTFYLLAPNYCIIMICIVAVWGMVQYEGSSLLRMLVLTYVTTQCHNPDDHNMTHHCGNFKYYNHHCK